MIGISRNHAPRGYADWMLRVPGDAEHPIGIPPGTSGTSRVYQNLLYYDSADVAVHSFLFFYLCHPKTLAVCEDNQVADNAVEKPRWVEIDGLENAHFHNHGQLILEAIRSL